MSFSSERERTTKTIFQEKTGGIWGCAILFYNGSSVEFQNGIKFMKNIENILSGMTEKAQGMWHKILQWFTFEFRNAKTFMPIELRMCT